MFNSTFGARHHVPTHTRRDLLPHRLFARLRYSVFSTHYFMLFIFFFPSTTTTTTTSTSLSFIVYLLHPLDVKFYRKFVLLSSRALAHERTQRGGANERMEKHCLKCKHISYLLFCFLPLGGSLNTRKINKTKYLLHISVGEATAAAAPTGDGCFVVIVIVGVIPF